MNSTTVREFVDQQHHYDAWLYLILDPTAAVAWDDPIHIEALRETLGEDCLTRIPRPDLSHDPDACPVLVTLAEPGSSPLLDMLLMSGRRAQDEGPERWPYVCGWLSSRQGPEVVGNHLATLGVFQNAHREHYYPLYEPLRLELLATACQLEHSDFWWPVQRWLLPASHGGHWILNSDAPGDLELRSDFAAAQEDVPLVRSVLATWRSALRRPLTYAPARWNGPTVLPPRAAAQVLAHIRQARELGLHGKADIEMLALHRVMLHPRLHWHPTVQALIGQAAQGKASLANLFMPFQDRDWRRIVSDLNSRVGS
jgi:hypothetical protein